MKQSYYSKLGFGQSILFKTFLLKSIVFECENLLYLGMKTVYIEGGELGEIFPKAQLCNAAFGVSYLFYYRDGLSE